MLAGDDRRTDSLVAQESQAAGELEGSLPDEPGGRRRPRVAGYMFQFCLNFGNLIFMLCISFSKCVEDGRAYHEHGAIDPQSNEEPS